MIEPRVAASTACSFCRRPQHEVWKLVAGPDDVFICDQCVTACQHLISTTPNAGVVARGDCRRRPRSSGGSTATWSARSRPRSSSRSPSTTTTSGSRSSARASATWSSRSPTCCWSVHGHRQDAAGRDAGPDARRALRRLRRDHPHAGGYVGEDVENILRRLLQAAAATSSGASRASSTSMRSTRSRASPRASLSRATCPAKASSRPAEDPGRHRRQRPAPGRPQAPAAGDDPIDTTNILFICGGAFVGLDAIVERRLGRRTLGFLHGGRPSARRRDGAPPRLEPEDLISFGLIPEFVSRLAVVATLDALDQAALVRVLTSPATRSRASTRSSSNSSGWRSRSSRCARRHRHAGRRAPHGRPGPPHDLEELMLDQMYTQSGRESGQLVITRELVDGLGAQAERQAG